MEKKKSIKNKKIKTKNKKNEWKKMLSRPFLNR